MFRISLYPGRSGRAERTGGVKADEDRQDRRRSGAEDDLEGRLSAYRRDPLGRLGAAGWRTLALPGKLLCSASLVPAVTVPAEERKPGVDCGQERRMAHEHPTRRRGNPRGVDHQAGLVADQERGAAPLPTPEA